ncbi:hypothetical protein L0Z72_13925 [candidate division KSB1 bacterium]|nr:hypothetical protein [candidate division KSB1 bacterium]
MYQPVDIFNDMDRMICAESTAEFGRERPILFYYNPEKKIKRYQGDSLSILKKIPYCCNDMIFADPPNMPSWLVVMREMSFSIPLLALAQQYLLPRDFIENAS